MLTPWVQELTLEPATGNLTDMAALPNLFRNADGPSAGELVTALLTTAALRIERIESHGQSSPPGFWYEQATAEWVVVLRGAARLEFEGEEPFEMPAGAYVNIPAGRRHRVAWTDPDQPTIWLAIHYSADEEP
jgi:cupin 2 domain-containing protein